MRVSHMVNELVNEKDGGWVSEWVSTFMIHRFIILLKSFSVYTITYTKHH